MGQLRNGATPTYTIDFSQEENLDFGDCDKIEVTIAKKDKYKLTLTKDDLDEITAKTLKFWLSQEQTLAMPVGDLDVIVNFTVVQNGRTHRGHSDLMHITFRENPNNEVM